MIRIGFTGTRAGMSPEQFHGVRRVIVEQSDGGAFYAHHGDCVGADAEFHDICSTFCGRALVTVHPGPVGDLSAGCQGVERRQPAPHMARNRAIVSASDIVIAAPLESAPQPSGGTWSTIRMALKALRAGKLQALYVVGRDGALLEWEGWP